MCSTAPANVVEAPRDEHGLVRGMVEAVLSDGSAIVHAFVVQYPGLTAARVSSRIPMSERPRFYVDAALVAKYGLRERTMVT